MTIETPGLYEIAIPFCGGCDCAHLDYIYFITFHIVTAFPEEQRPDAVTDDFPFFDTSYYRTDSGSWSDVVYLCGFPGELVMRANVVCCEFPVDIESETWGCVKAMYR